MTKNYIFRNFTSEPFTGYWNGKPYTFKPGVEKQYVKGIAVHFAKHLTNQVLTENGKERYTSPKKPWEVPEFMDVFNQALIVEEIPDQDNLEINDDKLEINEPSMNIRVEKREEIDPYDATANKVTGPGTAPQIIGDEVGDDDGEEADYADPSDSNKSDDKPKGSQSSKTNK